MENLNQAFGLLAVGMLTVFTILLIVILLGKGLISIVNRVAPEEVNNKGVKPSTTPAAVDAKTQSIIKVAVDQLTNGKGTVTKIQKI